MKIDRIAPWIEMLANLGVIVSLIFLVAEVRNNTEVLQINAAEDRTAALNRPLLTNPALAEILSKIKAVDGSEPIVDAFVERYDLNYAEATMFIRYLGDLWTGLDSEFTQLGRSDALAHRIRQLLVFPDQALWFEAGGPDWFMSQAFQSYVRSLRAEM